MATETEPMPPPRLMPGDVVKLKSGSPFMTVVRLGEAPDTVVVVWCNNQGSAEMAEIETVALRIARRAA